MKFLVNKISNSCIYICVYRVFSIMVNLAILAIYEEIPLFIRFLCVVLCISWLLITRFKVNTIFNQKLKQDDFMMGDCSDYSDDDSIVEEDYNYEFGKGKLNNSQMFNSGDSNSIPSEIYFNGYQ